jgi:hypothetical protein
LIRSLKNNHVLKLNFDIPENKNQPISSARFETGRRKPHKIEFASTRMSNNKIIRNINGERDNVEPNSLN